MFDVSKHIPNIISHFLEREKVLWLRWFYQSLTEEAQTRVTSIAFGIYAEKRGISKVKLYASQDDAALWRWLVGWASGE